MIIIMLAFIEEYKFYILSSNWLVISLNEVFIWIFGVAVIQIKHRLKPAA